MDIKEGITKIVCKNSHDTGEGILIDFNKIHDFKDEIYALFSLHFVSKHRELLEDFLIYMATNDRKPFENYGVLINDYNKQKIL